MARSKTSGSPAEVQVSHLFGTTLLDRLQVSKLRLLFEHLFPEKKIEQRGASTLLMNCFAPGHTDRKPSFYVYANLNFAKCKSCGYQTRNLLDMLQISLGITYAEAILKIFEITGQRVANDKVTKQLNALDVHQQATRIFGEVCNAHLINLITYSLNGAPVPESDAPFYNDAVFHTVRPTLNWLYSQRHLDPSKVAYMPYGMLPTDTLFLRLAEKRLDELAGQMLLREGSVASAFSKDRRAEILASLKAMQKLVPAEYLHAVTFHTGHSTTLAGTIRLRKVARDGGTDNNFWNLPGFSGQEPLGYLGLMQPRNSGLRRSDLAETKVLMVESEISMLAIQEYLIEHSVPDVLVVASAGSNNDTEALYRAGFTDVYALMDHPDPALGRGEDQIKIRLTTSLQIVVQVFTAWEEFRGGVITLKDPDDVLQHHGWAHFRKWVFDQMATSFVPADAWAADRAIEEGQNIPANNVLARQGKAVEFGHCVRHPALLAAFVARVSRELDIPAAPLRAASVKIKDDEAGFVARIVEQLKTDFIVLYKDETKPGTLVLFHKADRRYITINVTDGNAMIAALSNVYGEMFTYFVDHIGLPARKEGEDLLPVGLAIRDGQKLIGDYLKIAFQSI